MNSFERKLIILHLNGEHLSLQAVAPTNAGEHEELCRLDQDGLTKLMVVDTSSSYIFSKSAVQKLIRNILSSDNLDFEMIDSSRKIQRILQIKASNISARDAVYSSEMHLQSVHDEIDPFDTLKKRYISLISRLNPFKISTVSNADYEG